MKYDYIICNAKLCPLRDKCSRESKVPEGYTGKNVLNITSNSSPRCAYQIKKVK